jgi:hypothetical protein
VTVEDVMAVDWPLYLQSVGCGALIGVLAALFLLLGGRITEISGIAGGLLGSRTRDQAKDRGGMALDRFVPFRLHRMPA